MPDLFPGISNGGLILCAAKPVEPGAVELRLGGGGSVDSRRVTEIRATAQALPRLTFQFAARNLIQIET